MTRRLPLLLLLLCALIACRKEAPPPAAAPKAAAQRAPEPDTDADNLLNFAYGGSVVSRTGELNLESSAVHAIDGFIGSVFACSPGSPRETLVYSLLAPAAVTQVGVTPGKVDVPARVRFDTSMDGWRWTEVATVKPEAGDTRQLWSIKETVARYIRVQPLDDKYYIRLRGIHAIGRELEPPSTPSFGGCWTINGNPAQLTQEGARITGVIATDPPTYLDGGTDNRVGMVMWMQGPMWGYAALTRTPDGQQITGLKFHEEIDSRNVGEGWFGEKCSGAGSQPAGRMPAPQGFLQRMRRYSAYGLAYDSNGRLLVDLSRSALDAMKTLNPRRIVVREFRFDTPQQNQAYAKAKADALRVHFPNATFEVAADQWDGPPVGAALQRVLASRVDIIPAQ
ncbi:MAG TPA: discoidin domain-containing protein [Thermoanaerobaculia bacterium]